MSDSQQIVWSRMSDSQRIVLSFYKMIVFKSGFSTNAFLMQNTFLARNTTISLTSLIRKRLNSMVVILEWRFTTKL